MGNKHRKLGRITIFILVIIALCALSVSAQPTVGSQGPISGERGMTLSDPVGESVLIMVNDRLLPINLKAYPRLEEGVVYAPLEMLVKGFGCRVDKADENILEITKEGYPKLVYDLSKGTAALENGQAQDITVLMRNGTAMVPVRWFGEQQGYQCAFFPTAPLVRFTNGEQNIEDSRLYSYFYRTIERMKLLLKGAIEQEIREELERAERERAAKEKDPALKVVYLTFDDGPGPYTEGLLETMREYNMQATFFMIGYRLHNYAEKAVMINEQGSALGLHGMTHIVKYFYKDTYSPLKEMRQVFELLLEKTGLETRLVRVPYGSYPLLKRGMYQALVSEGFRVWDWNVDSGDSKSDATNPEKLAEKTIADIKRKGEGAVVLLHEKLVTLQALPIICKWMYENGYTSNALTEEMDPMNWGPKLK